VHTPRGGDSVFALKLCPQFKNMITEVHTKSKDEFTVIMFKIEVAKLEF
jgi:hypothetical protein